MLYRYKHTANLSEFTKGIKEIYQNVKGLFFKNPKVKENILKSELDEFAGLRTELTNPDSLLNDKNFDLTKYDEMLLDDKIKFSVDIKKKLILSVPYKIVEASDSPEHIEQKEFVENVLDNMKIKFRDVLENLLDAMVYGFKIGEIRWQLNKEGEFSNKYAWTDIYFKHSLFFDFKYDEWGNLEYMEIGRNYGGDGDKIDYKQFLDRFMYFCYPYLKDGNYYGDSDLKEVFFEYRSKYFIRRYRNVYLQNFGMPVPIVTYIHDKMTVDEHTELNDMLENWQEQMRVKIPGFYDKKSGKIIGKFTIDFKDISASKGTEGYDKAIKQINDSIMYKFLVPSKLGYSEDPVGSHAQSKKIFEIVQKIIKDLHIRIEEVINPHIKRLVDYNYITDEYPFLKFDDVTETIEAEQIKILVDAGVIDKRERWIRRYVNIPELSEEEQKEIEEKKEEDREKAIERFQPQFPPQQQPQQQFPPKQKEQTKLKTSKLPINLKRIEDNYNKLEEKFTFDYKKEHMIQSERLMKAIERKKIIESKDFNAINKLRIVKKGLKDLFSQYFGELYIAGKTDAITETQNRIKGRDPEELLLKALTNPIHFQTQDDWLSAKWVDNYLKQFGGLASLTQQDRKYLSEIRSRAFFITGETEERMLKLAYHTIENGIRSGLAGKTIISQLQQFLREDRKKYATTIVRTNESSNYNNGRMNFFFQDDISKLIEAYQYNATMDNVTTVFCQTHNNQIIKKSDPNLGTIIPPNHHNCRSILIQIFIIDTEDPNSYYYDWENKFDIWGKGVPSEARLPSKGFGGV